MVLQRATICELSAIVAKSRHRPASTEPTQLRRHYPPTSTRATKCCEWVCLAPALSKLSLTLYLLQEYRLRKNARDAARHRDRAEVSTTENSIWSQDGSREALSLPGNDRLPVALPYASAASTLGINRPTSQRSSTSTGNLSTFPVSPSILSMAIDDPSDADTAHNIAPSTGNNVKSSDPNAERLRIKPLPPITGHNTAAESQSRGLQLDDADLSTDSRPEDVDSISAPSIILHSDMESNAVSSDVMQIEGSNAVPEAEIPRRGALRRDDSAYGIPTTIMIDGKPMNISEMDILVQVEMLRKAAAQKHQAKTAVTSGDLTSSIREEMQQMVYTELSDIA